MIDQSIQMNGLRKTKNHFDLENGDDFLIVAKYLSTVVYHIVITPVVYDINHGRGI